MARSDGFYRILLTGQQAAGATSVEGLRSIIAGIAPGRYQVEEIRSRSSFLPPEVRAWGWIVRHEDGSVDLEPAEHPAPQ